MPLPGPGAARAALPLRGRAAALERDARTQVRAVLAGRDDRLLAITGPWPAHGPVAAVEYASRLGALQDTLHGELLIVMRACPEKPRHGGRLARPAHQPRDGRRLRGAGSGSGSEMSRRCLALSPGTISPGVTDGKV